jgi:hypothetical protein
MAHVPAHLLIHSTLFLSKLLRIASPSLPLKTNPPSSAHACFSASPTSCLLYVQHSRNPSPHPPFKRKLSSPLLPNTYIARPIPTAPKTHPISPPAAPKTLYISTFPPPGNKLYIKTREPNFSIYFPQPHLNMFPSTRLQPRRAFSHTQSHPPQHLYTQTMSNYDQYTLLQSHHSSR